MNDVHFFAIEKVGVFAPNKVSRPTSSRRVVRRAGRERAALHWGEEPNQGAA
jgi:hypothetical protein